MSKFLAVGLALVCLVVAAQAADTTITIKYASGADCAATGFPQTIIAGTCTNSVQQGTSYAYYATSAYVYFYNFGKVNCTSTEVTQVAQYPVGCGKSSYGTSYTVTGADVPGPLSFPPSGFTVSTQYVNTTASNGKVTGCSTGNGVVSYQVAYRLGYCQTRSVSDRRTQPSSTASYCNADGTYAGEALFNTADCTGTVVSASLSAVGGCIVDSDMESASSAQCGSSAAILPSSAPTQGYRAYKKSDCSDANPDIELIQAACFDSQTLTFPTINGTVYGSLQQYTKGAGSDGACTATQGEPQQGAVDVCTKIGSGDHAEYRKYTNNFNPNGNSAASVQVSMIAALVASIVALVAGRSL